MDRPRSLISSAIALLFLAGAAAAATFTVSKVADTNDGFCDADCSLREAIAAANAAATADVIIFGPLFSSPQTITLTLGEIVITNNGALTIYGTGANRLTVSGNNTGRIFTVNLATANLSGIRFTAGNGVGAANSGRAGALYNFGGTTVISNSVFTGNSAANGGALNNAANGATPANLTLRNCAIINNSSTSSGAALQNFSTSTITIENTTVSGNNTTSTGIAGGFQANGMVIISNSTFSGNTASGTGGAIYYNGTGMTMNNVTIDGNTSALGSGGLHKATATLNANVRNSLFAGNTGAAGNGDVAGAISSQGHNLIATVGTSTGWVATDLQNMPALTGPFGFHGGHGMTYPLLVGSLAIDGGDNCVADASCTAGNPPSPLPADERGSPRIGNVDIGAYEANGTYTAVLPSAVIGTPYNLTLVPVSGGFTYLLNSGSFGGIALSSSTDVALGGTAPAPGTYDGLVQITGAPGQAFVNYRINVLFDPNLVWIGGRVFASDGTPLAGATVSATTLGGASYGGRTNQMGYFRVEVPAGITATLNAVAKGHIFSPVNLTANDVVDGVILTSSSPGEVKDKW